MRYINKIIIHCSASNNPCYDFKRIHHDHTIHNKWRDIGYHYGIDFDGKFHVLRDVSIPGAHTRGQNENSIGICILGLDRFNSYQFESLASVVSTFMRIFDLNAGDIYGHRDFTTKKTCPNFDVEKWKIDYLESKLCHWN